MNRRVGFIILLILLLSLSACMNIENEGSIYYETMDAAIEEGLEEADIILAIDKYKEDTLVFFDRDEALGSAMVEETKKGFRLIRNNPFIGFEGDVDYSTGGFNMTITGGETIEILAGKVFKPDISKIMIEEINMPAVEVWDREKTNSKLFYYILNGKYEDHEIIVIRD